MGASGLGSLLVEEGILTESDRQTIKKVTGQQSGAFAKGVLALGLLDEDELTSFLSMRTRYKVAPRDLLSECTPEALAALDSHMLAVLEILPISLEEGHLRIAIGDPLDKSTIRQIEFFTGLKVVPVIAPFSQIYEGISRIFPDFKPTSDELQRFIRNHAGSASRKIQLDDKLEGASARGDDDFDSSELAEFAEDDYDNDLSGDIVMDENMDEGVSGDDSGNLDLEGLDDLEGDDLELSDGEDDLELSDGDDEDLELSDGGDEDLELSDDGDDLELSDDGDDLELSDGEDDLELSGVEDSGGDDGLADLGELGDLEDPDEDLEDPLESGDTEDLTGGIVETGLDLSDGSEAIDESQVAEDLGDSLASLDDTLAFTDQDPSKSLNDEAMALVRNPMESDSPSENDRATEGPGLDNNDENGLGLDSLADESLVDSDLEESSIGDSDELESEESDLGSVLGGMDESSLLGDDEATSADLDDLGEDLVAGDMVDTTDTDAALGASADLDGLEDATSDATTSEDLAEIEHLGEAGHEDDIFGDLTAEDPPVDLAPQKTDLMDDLNPSEGTDPGEDGLDDISALAEDDSLEDDLLEVAPGTDETDELESDLSLQAADALPRDLPLGEDPSDENLPDPMDEETGPSSGDLLADLEPSEEGPLEAGEMDLPDELTSSPDLLEEEGSEISSDLDDIESDDEFEDDISTSQLDAINGYLASINEGLLKLSLTFDQASTLKSIESTLRSSWSAGAVYKISGDIAEQLTHWGKELDSPGNIDLGPVEEFMTSSSGLFPSSLVKANAIFRRELDGVSIVVLGLVDTAVLSHKVYGESITSLLGVVASKL